MFFFTKFFVNYRKQDNSSTKKVKFAFNVILPINFFVYSLHFKNISLNLLKVHFVLHIKIIQEWIFKQVYFKP